MECERKKERMSNEGKEWSATRRPSEAAAVSKAKFSSIPQSMDRFLSRSQRYLMRPGFGNEPQIGNVDGSFQLRLVRGVEDRIEWYLGQDLVYTEFVRIEHHDGGSRRCFRLLQCCGGGGGNDGFLRSKASRIEDLFVVVSPIINIEHDAKLEFVAWIVVYTVYVIVEWRMT
jgi:hypothetical protein